MTSCGTIPAGPHGSIRMFSVQCGRIRGAAVGTRSAAASALLASLAPQRPGVPRIGEHHSPGAPRKDRPAGVLTTSGDSLLPKPGRHAGARCRAVRRLGKSKTAGVVGKTHRPAEDPFQVLAQWPPARTPGQTRRSPQGWRRSRRASWTHVGGTRWNRRGPGQRTRSWCRRYRCRSASVLLGHVSISRAGPRLARHRARTGHLAEIVRTRHLACLSGAGYALAK